MQSWSLFEFQARQMLLRTAHNRTRKLPVPNIDQLFFWEKAMLRKVRARVSGWGPGYAVGRLPDGVTLGWL